MWGQTLSILESQLFGCSELSVNFFLVFVENDYIVSAQSQKFHVVYSVPVLLEKHRYSAANHCTVYQTFVWVSLRCNLILIEFSKNIIA